MNITLYPCLKWVNPLFNLIPVKSCIQFETLNVLFVITLSQPPYENNYHALKLCHIPCRKMLKSVRNGSYTLFWGFSSCLLALDCSLQTHHLSEGLSKLSHCICLENCTKHRVVEDLE